MEKLIIYTNETCPYCKQIKEELNKANIEFENKLTSKFKDEWQGVVGLTGMTIVPTICYKDNYLTPGRDFNNAIHLVNIIQNFKPSDYSIEKQTLEKIKTLTYNIHTAFGRLDQLLQQIENKLNIKENEHESTS